MNTRQTTRSKWEQERDNTTDEERDRERDEYERLLQQEESRTRRRARRNSRDVLSRRVTGAEQPTSSSTRGKRLSQDETEVDATPPKQPHKVAVRAQSHMSRGAHRPETETHYRGTEPPATGGRGLETQTQPSGGEGGGVLRERRRLFTDMDTVGTFFEERRKKSNRRR